MSLYDASRALPIGLALSLMAAMPAQEYFQESGGTVVMEAEHYQTVTAHSDGSIWEIKTDDPDALGGEYITDPNDGTPGYSSPGGSLATYDIDFQTTGTYYVYVRTSADGGTDDSIYVNGSRVNTSFSWGYNQGPSLQVDNTGIQTLTLGTREDGARVDRIVLSTTQGEPSDSLVESPIVGSEPELALNAIATSHESIQLSWNDDFSESSFLVTWASDANFDNIIDTQSLPANTTSWELTGLSADTEYHIKVEAVE